MLSEKGTRKIVAVIGDIMIDRYLTGRVDRISPEAPVPVLLHSHDRAVAGGAANVAVNIVALGCEVKLVGAVGNDQDAEDLRRILAEAGVSTTLLVTDHSRPTISKTRVVSGRQQFFRIDREFPGRLSAEAEDDLIRAARAAIAEAEVVVLSDYAKGVFSDQRHRTQRIQRKPSPSNRAGVQRESQVPDTDFFRIEGFHIVDQNPHSFCVPFEISIYRIQQGIYVDGIGPTGQHLKT